MAYRRGLGAPTLTPHERVALLPPEPAKCTFCGNVHNYPDICVLADGARR